MTTQYNLMMARFPGNFQEHPDSSDWVMFNYVKALSTPAIGQVVHWHRSETPISMVRNQAVKAAKDNGSHYLLMIDADMHPDYIDGAPKFLDVAWSFMMDRREREAAGEALAPATIGAPYCTSGPDETPVAYRLGSRNSGDAKTAWKLTCYDRETAIEKTGVEEVPALGTGLILYDMRVFDALPAPWFDYEYADEPYRTKLASTEDIYQTRNAAMLGLPQYLAWDCWCIHHKLKPVPKPQQLELKHVHDDYSKAVIAAAARKGLIRYASQPTT